MPAVELDRLYHRTKATNYWGIDNRLKRGSWRWCGEERFVQKGHDRYGDGYTAAEYVMELFGNPQNAWQMAARGDWIRCFQGAHYRMIGSRSEPGPTRWRMYCLLRSLPWPQKALPTDCKKLARLQRKINALTPADWTEVIDETLRRSGKEQTVHMGVITIDESPPCEDKLLRSELIAALSVIEDQVTQKINWRTHAVYPVFVYSFAGSHVRVLQVQFDPTEAKLIVRKTTYIEISGPDSVREIKLLLQWIMAKPTGNTRFEELDIKLEEAESDLRTMPPSPSKRSIGIANG